MKSKKLAVVFITIGFVLGLVCGIFAPSLYAKLKKKNSFNIYEIRTNNHTYTICDYSCQFGAYTTDGYVENRITDKKISGIINKVKSCIGEEFEKEKANDDGIFVGQEKPSSYIIVRTYTIPKNIEKSLDEIYKELEKSYGGNGLTLSQVSNYFSEVLSDEKTYTIISSKEEELFNIMKETVESIKEVNSDDN